MNQLDQLKAVTTVVADTGNFLQLAQFAPRDATTNPSLILKAVQSPDYAPLLKETVAAHRGRPLDEIVDHVLVRFGLEILKVVPGRVSTEVDARLSFDKAASLARARRIISLYEAAGVTRERVLIKLASTWEGIQAAAELEREGIHCNLTLLFAFAQAVACGEAGVQLISPFVGRILDWYVANGQTPATIDEDPGVVFVRGVYAEFKRRGSRTVVMGASFRSTAQIEALAGCDRLTISPDLLEKLDQDHGELPRKLSPGAVEAVNAAPVTANSFAAAIEADPMAKEKLATGIEIFAKDLTALRTTIREKLAAN